MPRRLRPPIPAAVLLTAEPHDTPDALGTQPPDGPGASVAPEELAEHFLTDVTESTFPGRGSSLHPAIADEPNDDGGLDPRDVERMLKSPRALSRLVNEAMNDRSIHDMYRALARGSRLP